MLQHYPFQQQPLPCLYDSLEPCIDTETMYFHHTRHLTAFLDQLNAALAPFPEFHEWTLERLLLHEKELPPEIRESVSQNAGGVYCHQFYFESLSPRPQTPCGRLLDAILLDFSSAEHFLEVFTDMALAFFGCGNLWLVSDNRGKLIILPLPGQAVPLTEELHPLLNLDLWEHAYYLKHQNRRADYISDWLRVVNWAEVDRRYGLVLLSIALFRTEAAVSGDFP